MQKENLKVLEKATAKVRKAPGDHNHKANAAIASQQRDFKLLEQAFAKSGKEPSHRIDGGTAELAARKKESRVVDTALVKNSNGPGNSSRKSGNPITGNRSAPASVNATVPHSRNGSTSGEAGDDAFFGTVSELGANGEGGLLDCEDTRAQYGCPVFLPGEHCTNLSVGDAVVFHVEVGPDGLPEARDVHKVDGMR